MPWIERRSGGWLPGTHGALRRPAPQERAAYTVTEAAAVLGVDRRTIRKYMALDPEDEAPILFDEWYRLPGGHIRIHVEAVERLREA